MFQKDQYNWYNCHLHVPLFFSIPYKGWGTYPSFHIPSVLYCGQPGQQSRQFCKFFFFFLIIIRSGLLANIIIIIIIYSFESFSHQLFDNGPGDRGSIPGWITPKTQKMVLNAALLSTQHYKVRIKGKFEQSREWNCALAYTSV